MANMRSTGPTEVARTSSPGQSPRPAAKLAGRRHLGEHVNFAVARQEREDKMSIS